MLSPSTSVMLHSGAWVACPLTSSTGSDVTKHQTPWMVQNTKKRLGLSRTRSKRESCPSFAMRVTR